jgi:hypothetical protein
MASTNSALVVTENSNLSIAVIVKLDLLLDANVAVWEFFEKGRHSE